MFGRGGGGGGDGQSVTVLPFCLSNIIVEKKKEAEVYLASERSERDTYRIGDVYLFIYVWTYVRHFCTLTLAFLCKFGEMHCPLD